MYDIILVIVCLKQNNEVIPMRKFGDRYDAYRIRDIDGMHHYMAYLMPKRTDAEVYINETIDVTELLKYISEKMRMGNARLLCFTVFLRRLQEPLKCVLY